MFYVRSNVKSFTKVTHALLILRYLTHYLKKIVLNLIQFYKIN